MGCKNCGRHTDWDDYHGCPEDYCGDCYDSMAERERNRREWAHHHPREERPEIED